MKWANAFLLVINVVIAFILFWYIGTPGLLAAPRGWDYKDLVTILLTAIAVMLGAATIFVAALAVYGYTAIREAAERAA